MERYPLSGVIIADSRAPASVEDPAAEARPSGLAPVHAEKALTDVAPLVDDIVWVASDPAALLDLDGLIVRDHFQPPSVLSAIHAGLFAARRDQILVLSAGRPSSRPVLDLLAQAAAPRWDGVLLEAAGGAQVLPAVYHKRCLKLLTRQLAEGRCQPGAFLRQLHRHLIPEALVRRADPRWLEAPTPKE
jgi:molybdopterin-guanine dinucleotide biosynthesis protein A